MTISSVETFTLLDGTKIPWLAWGNGTGEALKTAVESGHIALESGIRHLDTAQWYKNEKATGLAIAQASVDREDIFVTSKIANTDDGTPWTTAVDDVRKSVQGSLDELGFVPDLYLVHTPFVPPPGQIKAFWKVLESLKKEGKLKSIGVSNFRPQDLEEVLEVAEFKPVVNQLEYHPYTLAHLEPVLELQKKHGIVTESYGTLTPTLRHPTGGPLKPVLERIAKRISDVVGKPLDANVVLLLWARAQGVVVVTASGNPDRIKALGEIATLPGDLLERSEVDEITTVGKTIHYRHYTEHMEKDFPLPNLPHQ